ncbi:MAG: SurA N-terminal domain-containing protein [Spirochaetota bacterium]|nr:SurA N-terminal domain-containing protein [Spirochaetota bacterium]
MKTKIFYSVIAVMIFALAISCGNKYGGKWIAKIDSDEITDNELNAYYYAQMKSIYNLPKEEIDKLAQDPAQLERNPLLNKNNFLEQMIQQRLVYKKAIDDGILKNEELNTLLDISKEGLVVQYYIREKFKNDITIAPQEVEQIYNQQRARFKGVPVDQAEMYIKQQLFQQKLNMKIKELVDTLRDEKKIEKNMELLRKELNTQAQSQEPQQAPQQQPAK